MAGKKKAKKRSKTGAGKTKLGDKKKIVKLGKKAAQKYLASKGLGGKKPSINSLIRAAEAGTLSVMPTSFERPRFSSAKQKAARLEASLATGLDYTHTNLDTADLAAPHRAPYAALRDTVLLDAPKRVGSVMRLLGNASKIYEDGFAKAAKKGGVHATDLTTLQGYYVSTRVGMETALNDYENASKGSLKAQFRSKLKLIVAVNNLASNAPGLGPHATANLVVSDNLHLRPVDRPNEPYSPRSHAALLAFPNCPAAVASVKGSLKQVVSVTGALHSVNDGKLLSKVVKHKPTVVSAVLYVTPNGHQLYRPKKPMNQPSSGFNANYITLSGKRF